MSTRQIKSMAEAVDAWRELDGKRDRLKSQYEEKDALLKGSMQRLELWMMSELQKQGVDAVTVNGVARVAIREKRRFGCQDWDTFKQWAHALGPIGFDFFQKRLMDSNMQQYVEEHKVLPPGATVSTELIVAVTKAK